MTSRCDFRDEGVVGAEATADYCYEHQKFCGATSDRAQPDTPRTEDATTAPESKQWQIDNGFGWYGEGWWRDEDDEDDERPCRHVSQYERVMRERYGAPAGEESTE